MASSEGNSKDEWEQIEEEITCSICQDVFTEPKTILCLHTFCEQCIESSIESSRRSGSNISCPLCRTELSQDVAKLPTNFAIKRLIEIFRKRQESMRTTPRAKPVCGECEDDALAVVWCVDCENFQCEECLKQHQRMKSLKLHKTIPVENFMQNPHVSALTKPELCKDHTQPLDLYCQTCNILVCRDCTIVDHRQHQYNFVDKLADEECAKVKTVTAPLKTMLNQVSNALQEVEDTDNELNNETDVERQIQDMYHQLHQILDQCQVGDLKKVKVAKTALQTSLASQKSNLKLLQTCLVSCDEFVSKVTTTERATHDQLLIHSSDIQKRVNNLTNQIQQTTLKPVCGVDHLILSTVNPNDYGSHFASLCQISTLPHVPNCSAKGPLAMTKYGPVDITITLKDVDGYPVPNQSDHLTVHFKDENITGGVKIEEKGAQNSYVLSYWPKSRKAHSMSVSWKRNLIAEVTVPASIRDYSAIQREIQIIDNYGPDEDVKKLKHPYLLAVGPNDELVFRDYNTKQLVVFDDQFRYIRSIGKGLVDNPTAVVVSKNGYLYVTDHCRNVVKKISLTGELLSELGSKGNGKNQFDYPLGLLLLQSELLFICDSHNARVQVVKDDQFCYSFGQNGKHPGYFNQPNDLTSNTTEDQIFITDSGNHRIQVFSPCGQFLKVFGNKFYAQHVLRWPTGIFYTPDGHLLVSSSGNNRVLIFDEDGQFVSAIEGTFAQPIGVVMKRNGRIVVAGDFSNNLVVF